MLAFNSTTHRLENRKYYSSTDGYWHGTLTHIPVGPQGSKGWLISLMSQKGTLGQLFEDKPVQNDELGKDVRVTELTSTQTI
jgi:hypothetical protein